MKVIPSIASDRLLEDLRQRVASASAGVIHAEGLWGSAAPLVAAAAAVGSARPFLYVSAHLEEADHSRDDLELFLGRTCELFPAWETLPGEGAASGEIEAERNRLCSLLAAGGGPGLVMITPIQGLMQPVPTQEVLRANTLRLVVGQEVGGAATEFSPRRHEVQEETAGGAQRLRDKDEVARKRGNSGKSSAKGPSERAANDQTPGAVPRPPLATGGDLMPADFDQAKGPGLIPGGVSGPDLVLQWAIDRGFSRLDLVESPGDVARRGDIIDLFPPGENAPIRVQFDGDVVESIRRFDISAQRSIETLKEFSCTSLPSSPSAGAYPATDFLSYLPPDAVIVLDGPVEVQEMGRIVRSRLQNTERLYDVTQVLSRCSEFTQVHLGRFATAPAAGEAIFDFAVGSLSRFEGGATDAVDELYRLARDTEVYVFCDNEGERQRLVEMLQENLSTGRKPGGTDGGRASSPDDASNPDHRDQRGPSALMGAVPAGLRRAAPIGPAQSGAVQNIHVEIGMIHRGFVWTRTKTAVIGHHELFARQRQRRRLRRVEAGRPIESWTDLQPGDHVVHVVHGIAAYRGMRRMRKGDSAQYEEFLTLEFADGGVVHVPCSQIELVQKYIGAGGRKPQLSTLGGKRWSKTKERVAEAVSELAESLLRVQARRAEAAGTAYPPDTEWQREFEAAFPYEETEDQLTVATEIRGDLTRARPMDRLICGDVGYGKTELAMRAAFKVVEYGRQAAVLVPTTVLAEQHYESFRERMAGFPFSIASLSRFRSHAEQRVIVDKLRRGQVDIVIGTHRLLSKDVKFANLGLVIIDEEQRFGVEHKERLRAMRETVDVLTLTATPIPRTLHMSLMGIRDISALQTPPVDRRSIATYVRPFSREMIREAILREMNRDGQVFFVHNFVQSIAVMADTVRGIVPEARVVFGHGQMSEGELEEVMHKFSRREADVLVCTTIIESGIDIPSANTIFINRAERFGLADLHQLRGRVGRSSHRAYCYLMLSPDRPPNSKAAKRLKTIEEFSELGAGFRIAMRDLEIRGAGNLLGKEQSGHIAAVGYELYCRLVEQTVRRLKNEPDPNPPPVHVDLDVAAHVPSHYAASERARIEIYRRIAAARTLADLEQLDRDLVDAFGPIPPDLARLLELAEIRVLARQFGVVSISLQRPDVVFTVEKLPLAEPLFVNAPGTVRMPDARTVHLRLPPVYMQGNTLVNVLGQMLRRATNAEGGMRNAETASGQR